MPEPVVITRPLEQAEELARRVSVLGRKAILFPLLEIHPLTDPAPLCDVLDRLEDYSMAVFVSPNAIDATFAFISQWPREVALAVMGEGSRQALARHGLTSENASVVSPRNLERTDSDTLFETLHIEALRGKRVLILRGETGRELLSERLIQAGVQVDQVAAYRRSAPSLDDDRRAQLGDLLDMPAEWIITSSEALRILLDMVEKTAAEAGVEKIRQKKLIVPHVRIRETAEVLGFRHIVLTGSGDERMLAALQSST